MKQLVISEIKAKEMYPSATKDVKILLEESFGKEFFMTKITDIIKSYENAVMKNESTWELPHAFPRNNKEKRDNYLHMLIEIADALNEDWIIDMTSPNQKRYHPYMQLLGGSWVFCCSTGYSSFCSGGFGFFLRSEELCNYFGKTFEKLINDYLMTFNTKEK